MFVSWLFVSNITAKNIAESKKKGNIYVFLEIKGKIIYISHKNNEKSHYKMDFCL